MTDVMLECEALSTPVNGSDAKFYSRSKTVQRTDPGIINTTLECANPGDMVVDSSWTILPRDGNVYSDRTFGNSATSVLYRRVQALNVSSMTLGIVCTYNQSPE